MQDGGLRLSHGTYDSAKGTLSEVIRQESEFGEAELLGGPRAL
jgi:hypothetical protein